MQYINIMYLNNFIIFRIDIIWLIDRIFQCCNFLNYYAGARFFYTLSTSDNIYNIYVERMEHMKNTYCSHKCSTDIKDTTI